MQSIPNKFLKLRVISEVPVSQYADLAPPPPEHTEKERLSFFKKLRKTTPCAKASAPRTKKRLELNAASWMTFAHVPSTAVSLWLVYRDDRGEHSLLVDEQKLDESSRSLMLSGSVQLEIKGPLQSLRVCCGGLQNHDRFSVDELFVRRNASESTNVRLVG